MYFAYKDTVTTHFQELSNKPHRPHIENYNLKPQQIRNKRRISCILYVKR